MRINHRIPTWPKRNIYNKVILQLFVPLYVCICEDQKTAPQAESIVAALTQSNKDEGQEVCDRLRKCENIPSMETLKATRTNATNNDFVRSIVTCVF